MQAVFDQGVSELGRCDIVLANAGIMPIVGEPASRRASVRRGMTALTS